jgi:glycogen phosphorylase
MALFTTGNGFYLWALPKRISMRRERDIPSTMTSYAQLQDLAYNLRWAWHVPTRSLFRSLDPELWERVQHNPVALLRRLDPEEINARAELSESVASLHADLDRYRQDRDTWFRNGGDDERPLVAYFSAEFGIAASLRIYSGGLGVLAGDHLKSASDLGVPLVGVGLLYREGYFRQGVDGSGRQVEDFPAADFDDLQARPVTRDDGSPFRITVPFPGRQVQARVWQVEVGRIRLYLLDSDIGENGAEDRGITSRLYGGGPELRIAQELLLGIGGYRALDELGLRPRSYHMNEGHSAFLGLELIRDLMQSQGLTLDEAKTEARSRCVFTTHTPVPAGHDRFQRRLVADSLTPTAHALGLDIDELMDLGREDPGTDHPFTMTVLALRLSGRTNGVSALHGAVSRDMWQHLWTDRTTDEVPIDHITNGVHAPSWVHPAIAATYGVDLSELGVVERRPDPEPRELWRIHEERRADLVQYVRRAVGATLDPKALTIAFARRFATYKRATLLLGDLDRLARLLGNTDRPVQLIFAGKAHPRDEGGKALIQRIGEVSRDPRFRERIVFLPGYGIDMARHLVQGADVWLNNPRRPMEASGTSGMKAAMNGVLNVSILDGWWDEAWQHRDRDAPAPGWAVGEGREERTEHTADQVDAETLLRILEEEVAPLFYDRDADQVPTGWVARMRESVRQLAPVYNTHRMVADYVERYMEAAGRLA